MNSSTTFPRPRCPPPEQVEMGPFYLFLAIDLFILTGYGRILIVVARKLKTMKSPFFRLLQIQILSTVGTMIFDLEERFMRTNLSCEKYADWFTDPSFIYTYTFLFPLYYFPLFSGTVDLVVSLNRLTSILLPFAYDTIWEHMVTFVLVSILLPLVPLINVAVSPTRMQNIYSTGTALKVTSMNNLDMIDTAVAMAVFNGILTISVIFVSILTVYKLSQLDLSSIANVEKRTIGYGVVSSIGLLSVTAAQLTMYYFLNVSHSPYAVNIFSIRSYIIALNYTTPLVAILAFLPDIRRETFGQKEQVTVLTVSTNKQSK